ncbi:hypothetical protein HDU77_000423 [Chytriomyces hyalinus]|nr:hypothetical protein HDU77_000423 [Chytriomyces hyalinus]
MGFSMFTLLSFYLAVHHDLPPGRPIYQFFAIKFVLFVSYLQMFTLTFLVGMGVIKGTEVYSPSDVITAIAGFLTCVEMAFAAIVNCSVFSWKEFAVDDDAAVRRLSAAAAGFLIDWDTGVDGVGENTTDSNGRRRGSSRWRQTGRLGMLDAFVDFAKPDDLWDDGRLILRSLIAWVRGGGSVWYYMSEPAMESAGEDTDSASSFIMHYAAPLLPPLFLLNTARIALTTVPILHRFKSIRSLTYGILAITAFTTAAVLVQTTEQHPFTQRTRLMLIDETAELAAAEDTERQLMVTHAHAILPDFHPWSRIVHRVVDRLIGVVGKELRAWKVVVIDQRDCVNAMVLANGTIFVFTGILHALWEMERDLDGGSVDSRQQRATVDVEEAVARALAVALNGGKEKGSWWKSLLGMTFWSGRLSPPVSPDLEVGPMFTDTLAAVLAHEMAHVLSRHSAEDLGLTQFFQLFIDGLHGVLYALSVNLPGLTDLAGMGVDAVAPYLSTLPVSRLMEIEADVVGLFLMAVAGFNPSRASLFWKYLADRQGNPGDVDWNMFEEFLSTHPSHVRRSLELEKHETAAMEIYRAHKRIEDALRLHLKRGMADGTVSREREAAALDQLNHGMYTVLSEFVSSHDAFWYARKGFDQKLLEREQEVVKEYPVQNN